MPWEFKPRLKYGRFDVYTVEKGKAVLMGHTTTYLQALLWVQDKGE